MRWAPRIRRAALVAVALGGLARPAVAGDEKAACLAASEKAQQLRNQGKLSAAREQLGICNRSECPALVRQDCATWMNEILAAAPSVVCDAKDGRGKDLVDVKVSIDGVKVSDQIDGKAIVVDPGLHVFRFEAPNLAPVEERVVVKQGEKNRIVTATFATPPTEPQPPPPTEPPKRDEGSSTRTVFTAASIGAFGLGGVGLVVGGILGISANRDINDLKDTCGQTKTCAQSDVDKAERKRNIAIGSAIVGGVLVAGGVVLLLLRPSAPKAAAAPVIWLTASPNLGDGLDGGRVGLSGAF